jgi:hypothetical protein
MPVVIGADTYGCSYALEKRAYGIRRAGQALAHRVLEGGTLPSTYVIAGTVFNVVEIAITPNGTTDNQTALASATNASRGGVPTLLVLKPHFSNYIASNIRNVSADTYIVGYGATVEMTGYRNNAHVFNGNNAGIFGVRMVCPSGSSSKWPERHEFDKTVEPSKNGAISDANGGGATNEAWVVASGRSGIIIMDNIAYGSLTGFYRGWGNPTNCLLEGNSIHRTTSDSIHIVNSSTFFTVRRNDIYESGDDAISVVSYDKVENPTPPSNHLIEYNNVEKGRGRGLTVLGGQKVLHQFNNVDRTVLAPYLYACTATHNTHNTSAICRNNTAWRGGQRNLNHSNSGVLIACFTYSGATVTLQATNNKAFSYVTDWYGIGSTTGPGGGEAIRGIGTGITVSPNTGNTCTAINRLD